MFRFIWLRFLGQPRKHLSVALIFGIDLAQPLIHPVAPVLLDLTKFRGAGYAPSPRIHRHLTETETGNLILFCFDRLRPHLVTIATIYMWKI